MVPSRRKIRPSLAFAAVAALAAMLATHPADASGRDGRTLVVMTQNLYLGSSLEPAMAAASPYDLLEAISQIVQTVQYTDFPARAQAIADEVYTEQPDIIGLQEVEKWTTEGFNPPPGYDFLAILQSALAARGLSYSVAAVSDNAKIGEVPLAISEQSCPVLQGPQFTCGVTMEDRDVILVNDDAPGLTWSDPRTGHYANQFILQLPTVTLSGQTYGGTVSFDRGWASIDARLNGLPFTFVSTHLETEDHPVIQLAQASEFLAGPARGGNVIAVGDFNSAADGSTTATYALLTAPGNFRDAWNGDELGSGSTCCQESNTPPLAPGALNNPVSTLATRIDLVLTRAAASSDGDDAEVIGDMSFEPTPPFWPSDHAGVVATIRLAR